MMSYAKLTGASPRMLVLESRYWLDTACIHAAQTMGWEVRRTPVHMQGKMPREKVEGLLRALVEFRPDFILTINLSGMDETGLFARLFADLGVPYVTWFADDPRTILMGRTCYASDYAVALTWERAYTEYLRDCGFAEVHTLPLAADLAVFNAEPADHWPGPPAFVGNSMVDFAEREWEWLRERPDLEAAVLDAFARGAVTRERFAKGVGAMLDPAVAGTLDAEASRHIEMVCFIEGTRRVRRAMAEAVTPEGAIMHGDPAWATLVSHHGPPIDYTEELPAFYRACPVNLNTTSIQMATTVNQRVFDCPAAGGFLLTDHQTALEDLFDVEKEMATYHDHGELVDLLRFYRDHPAERVAMTRRARTRILGEHTYTHRLKTIEAIIRARYGG